MPSIWVRGLVHDFWSAGKDQPGVPLPEFQRVWSSSLRFLQVHKRLATLEKLDGCGGLMSLMVDGCVEGNRRVWEVCDGCVDEFRPPPWSNILRHAILCGPCNAVLGQIPVIPVAVRLSVLDWPALGQQSSFLRLLKEPGGLVKASSYQPPL